jgi:light-harvesting complex I chlorophyll a/b binding protein 1
MAQVQAMQQTLKKFGVPSSPMQRLALTQLASVRDPSMKAEVREAFSGVDRETQEKVRRVSKEVIVKASAFESLDKKDMPGVVAPLGFWDPLKLTADLAEGRLTFYREAELKNGRTAMLGVLGIIVGTNFHPFYEGAEPYSSPVASHFTPAMQANFWPSLVIACGLAELFSLPDGSKAPGDLGFDPLGLKPDDDKKFLELQNKEINNGRLAMIGFAGLIGKELLTGVKAF